MSSKGEDPRLSEAEGSDRSRALERRWVFGFSFVFLALTTLPYLLGYALSGENWRFTGFVFGVEDGNSYIAKMLSGSFGSWLFRSPYSATAQNGFLAFLPYLLLGKLAAGTAIHDQLVSLFHLFRLAAGFLCILATYDFLGLFLLDRGLRRLGLVLICVGGGLGWLLVAFGEGQWLGSLPLEFYSPETFGFLGFFGVPHLALGRAALLWCLLIFFKASEEKQNGVKPALKIASLWLLAGLAQPLDALVIGYVISLHLLVGAGRLVFHKSGNAPSGWQLWKGSLKIVLTSAILPGIFVLYTGIAFIWDPYLSAWAEQNIIRSPHPLHYLLAFGLLIPFAVSGQKRLAQRLPWLAATLSAWVLSLPLLAYLPFNLQRRLPEGIWIASVVIALGFFLQKGGYGVDERRKSRRYAFLFFVPSTVILLAGGIMAVLNPGMPVFRPSEEVAAFEFLSGEAEPGSVVLAAYETSNALPAWAPLRVVIGHGPESANLAVLRPQVEGFYQVNTDDTDRRALLRDSHVRYVIWGPAEKRLGEWDPGAASYLKPIYSENNYVIFEAADASE